MAQPDSARRFLQFRLFSFQFFAVAVAVVVVVAIVVVIIVRRSFSSYNITQHIISTLNCWAECIILLHVLILLAAPKIQNSFHAPPNHLSFCILSESYKIRVHVAIFLSRSFTLLCLCLFPLVFLFFSISNNFHFNLFTNERNKQKMKNFSVTHVLNRFQFHNYMPRSNQQKTKFT